MFRKVTYLIAVLLFFGLGSYAQNIVFTGFADKKYDGNKIVLYNRATGDRDSAVLQDGKFAITLSFKEPSRYMFFSTFEMKRKGGYSPFGILVAEPGTVTINADMENFSNSKVTGSTENEIYAAFAEVSGKAQQKILDGLVEKYGKEFVYNNKPDTTDLKFKQLMQEYNILNEAKQKDETERLIKCVKDNPGSFAAVYLLDISSRGLEQAEVESLYAILLPKYKETKNGKSIANGIEARKVTAIGKIAPDFVQPDTLGNAVKLSSLRGKYVLVDFWASWCGPCRAENPNLVKIFNSYKDKGFTVLGVSLDQPGKKDAWLAAIHKDGLTWTQVSDLKFWENEVAVLYDVKAIPTNLLLDKEGKIIAKDLKGSALDQKLSELLGN